MADALKYKQKIIHKKYKRFVEDVWEVFQTNKGFKAAMFKSYL